MRLRRTLDLAGQWQPQVLGVQLQAGPEADDALAEPLDFPEALKTESCRVCLPLEHLGQAIFVLLVITNCS